MQAEKRWDEARQKDENQRVPMEPVIVVKLLKTDTTHDLSQKAREDEEQTNGEVAAVFVRCRVEAPGAGFEECRL